MRLPLLILFIIASFNCLGQGNVYHIDVEYRASDSSMIAVRYNLNSPRPVVCDTCIMTYLDTGGFRFILRGAVSWDFGSYYDCYQRDEDYINKRRNAVKKLVFNGDVMMPSGYVLRKDDFESRYGKRVYNSIVKN